MLRLGVGHGVEAPNANDLPDGVASAVVGIGVGAQHAAQVCFEPEFVGGLAFLAPLVDAVALDGPREGGMHAHVDSGKCIVTTGGASAIGTARA
jgi:hypothetical protein